MVWQQSIIISLWLFNITKEEGNDLGAKYKRGTKERAIDDISSLLNRYANTKREKLLSYWLSDYTQYIKQEETFNPKLLKRYKRGEIIKANLGYKLGKEEGGAHYAVVLDKKNDLASDIITILPLSSKKGTTIIHRFTIDLGNEIYEKLHQKAQDAFNKAANEIEITPIDDTHIHIALDLKEFEKVIDEIDKMKLGSIALVSQITTISKMRIIKPQRTSDALSGICLNPETLDSIDKKIIELYTGLDTME